MNLRYEQYDNGTMTLVEFVMNPYFNSYRPADLLMLTEQKLNGSSLHQLQSVTRNSQYNALCIARLAIVQERDNRDAMQELNQGLEWYHDVKLKMPEGITTIDSMFSYLEKHYKIEAKDNESET